MYALDFVASGRGVSWRGSRSVPPGEFVVDLPLILLCLAPIRHPIPQVGEPIPQVGEPVPLVGGVVALVSGVVALISGAVALVSSAVALVSSQVALVGGFLADGERGLALFQLDVALIGVLLPGVERGVPLCRAFLPPVQLPAPNIVIDHEAIVCAPPPNRNQPCPRAQV